VVQNYAAEDMNGNVMSATDADVSILAYHSTRLAIDTLLGSEPSSFPYSMYLIGLERSWVFEAPFHTIPIETDHLPVAGGVLIQYGLKCWLTVWRLFPVFWRRDGVKILLPDRIEQRLTIALENAKNQEVGGILMGEHVTDGIYRVRISPFNVTVAPGFVRARDTRNLEPTAPILPKNWLQLHPIQLPGRMAFASFFFSPAERA